MDWNFLARRRPDIAAALDVPRNKIPDLIAAQRVLDWTAADLCWLCIMVWCGNVKISPFEFLKSLFAGDYFIHMLASRP